MKKFLLFFLIIGLIFSLAACNTPADDPGDGSNTDNNNDDDKNGDDDGKEEVIVTPEGTYVLGSSDNYPGAEIDLSDKNLFDISKYVSVTVNATLYTDEKGEAKAVTPNGDKKNLAQFKLLKATGDWDKDSNICGMYKDDKKENTKYNMNVDGNTTWNFPSGASGIPAKLLLQANWVDFTEDGVKVKSIKVNDIIFTRKPPKTDDAVPELDVVYGDSYVSVAGNKITFNNAMYSDGAAILLFPDSFPAVLAGKKLVIAFSISEHTDVPSSSGAANVEHQIHIQAANSDKNGFNGQNPSGSNGNVGQKYITLDSANETKWDGISGTISVSLNDLLNAAKVSADANDCKGPFDLDAIRIVNNGTTWDDTSKSPAEKHVRCKSYTLVIESVKVE